MGRLRSKVQPHTLSYTIWQKRYPFRIPFIGKWYPFPIPSLRLSIPFKLLKNGAVFKIWINHKNRTFSRLFHSHEMHLLALLGLYRPKWQISSPFHILQQVKCKPFYIPEAWKRYSFRAEPPGISHHKEHPPRVFYPLPPPPGTYRKTIPIR